LRPQALITPTDRQTWAPVRFLLAAAAPVSVCNTHIKNVHITGMDSQLFILNKKIIWKKSYSENNTEKIASLTLLKSNIKLKW